MPVAIFIMVILGGVAITLTRFTSQAGNATVQEAISVASFYAAESGAQYAMNRLFYSTTAVPTRTIVDANCGVINGSSISFSAAGLNNCSADITCGITNDLPANTISFYSITSTGQCGDNIINANRVVEVASRLEGPAP
ncbi:hypothetical protein R50073_31470 [Maricurvus nonylphenolicus]|uniref:hypothetical protein n=1 Tax=Maricurvus nonylphenolicus TaxID=1008307 RepID=UPI0036F1E19A